MRYLMTWWDADCCGIRHAYGDTPEECRAIAERRMAEAQADSDRFTRQYGGPDVPLMAVAQDVTGPVEAQS